MDRTKEYVLQCEKAWEIQKLWKPIIGDVFHASTSEKVEILSLIKNKYNAEWLYFRKFGGISQDDCIWLPRQDDLQKMVLDNPFGLIIKLYTFCNKREMPYWELIASMEQLWLAFVMKEKYQKTWDGKEWVK